MERKGKFSSDRDATLFFLCGSGWANESTGDIQNFGHYIWRISNDLADVHIPNTEITSILADFLKAKGIEDSPAFRSSLVGYFLIIEDSDDFVNIQEFPSELELLAVFRRIEREYDTFFADENNED